ncbi:hypothetical protein WA538_000092 [Blastocystis sp. DL]
MDRTSDFLGFVRKSKHLRDEPIKTPDLIRPTLSVDPFLVKSMHIYKEISLAQRYAITFAEKWKSISVSGKGEKEDTFRQFEEEMAGLMETLATSIHSIPFNDSHLPSLLRDEVILDLEDHLKQLKSFVSSMIHSYASYKEMLSILQPTQSFVDVSRTDSISSKMAYDRLLSSVPEQEREKMLSESVLIEKKLETELSKVR